MALQLYVRIRGLVSMGRKTQIGEGGEDGPLLPLPDGWKTWLRAPQVLPSSEETTLLIENVPSEWPSVVSKTHISFAEPSLNSICVMMLSASYIARERV